MKKLLLAATMLCALAGGAKADIMLGGQNWIYAGTDNLTLTQTVPGGNQPQNVQCVICGDHQPQQSATFGYTNFHNTGQPGQDLRYFSTNVSGGGDPGLDTVGLGYDGNFLRAYLLATGDLSLNFSIGIDVNEASTPQILQSFFLLNLSQHKVLAVYSLDPNHSTVIGAGNNGTGYPDWTLSGFNIGIGTDIMAGDQLIFYARLQNANDGPNSFFIIPAQVPGPVVGALLPSMAMAMGLLGFSYFRRRRAA